ncbi:MAG TPA: NADH-quinone oxidoreductase subunit NuoG, partial [Acidimicrobiales bacterium]|nr:NADH-quinone oxidoreductase subunit NuoG [Acidimicrobiales bacterium]
EGVGFTLDGRQLRAKKGELIISAAERAGTYIPRFCYHPRMKPVGMCRMCLVDIKGPRGFSLSPACYLPVTEGMEVVTQSPRVKKAQDGVLEFLLVNHPLDCPVCDKGGECPLQDQTLAYGPGETRFVEEKRHWEKPTPLSSLVLIDRERCIQCARCTRFAEEVAGDPAIDFASRSDSSEVSAYPGQPFVSNFSGNVVQICPVGALLAKPYRFKARPWDLEQVETTCTFCAVGCRVAAQSSSDQVVRFLGIDSDPVNWGWLCDKGRFCFEALNSPERLDHPMVRPAGTASSHTGDASSGTENAGGPDGLVRASWSEAFAAIVRRIADVPGHRIGIIGGARLPNEDAYAWAKLARTVLRTDNVDAQLGDGLPADLVASLPRATIDQVCGAPLVVTLGPDIKEELPVLYLRLRNAAVEAGAQIIELSPAPTGLSRVASQTLRYRPGDLSALARSLCGDAPVTEAVAGVSAQDVERARAAIASASSSGASSSGASSAAEGPPRVAVVIGRPSLAEPATGVAEAALLLARLPGVAFLPALRRANVHGAIDLGLAPGLLPGRTSLDAGREWYERQWGAQLPQQSGLDTLGMLEQAANGRMDVLFLLGADPISDCPDKDLAVRALERARFVVAVDTFSTPSTAHADVFLPAAIYTERRGSFTNIEGRVTWLGQKVTAPGSARPDWMIAVELASRLGANLGVTSLAELWAEIEVVSPLHRGVSQALLVSRQARDGVVVPLQLETTDADLSKGPAPLDPMADPGIASVETHPAPPVDLSVARGGTGRGNAAGTGPEESPLSPPPRLQLQPPDATSPQPSQSSQEPRAQSSLRLVTSRPMWDAGAFVQHSPSLASLHPPVELRANPEDLERLGVEPGTRARASARGRQASVVVTAVADAGVPAGTVVLPFNLPGGGAGQLIGAPSPVTEISLEKLEG